VLAGLWGLGAAALFRQLEERQATLVAQAVAAAREVVEEAQEALLREARILAQDAAVVEGAVKGEWAPLARGASARMIALTVERLADLLLVLDARGGTLVQVPALPRASVPDLAPVAAPRVVFHVIDGRAYLLAAAPIRGAGAAPAGAAIVGRRLARLERPLGSVAARPAVVALAGDRLLGATRAEAPADGWAAAARTGTVEIAGEPWALRPLGPIAGLWALVPEAEYRAERERLRGWLLGSLAVAVAAVVAAACLTGRTARRTSATADDLDSARRFGDETIHGAQLAALLEINKKIGAAESADALLRAIAEEAARLLDVDNAGFRLVEGDELVLAGLAGTAAQTMLRPRIKVGESFSGRVVREGRTIAADVAEVPEMVPEHRAADARLGYTTYLGVPLRAGERIIGVFTFRARHPFTARDRELAEAFAGQAAIALEHARLYREASRQAERMAALADVERLLSETLDPDVVAQRVADNVRGLLAAEASVVYRLEPASGALMAMAVSGAVGPAFPRSIALPKETGVSGLAVRERRAVVTRDLLNDPGVSLPPEVRAQIEQAPVRAVLAVPLRVHDRVIGALGVGDRAGRIFEEQDIRLAQAFADQATLALENARLFALETARRAQVEVLAEVEGEFAAELNLDRLLQLIVDRAGRLFGADGVIYLVEEERRLTPSAWSEHALFDRRVPFGHGLVGACAEERRGLVVNDYAASPYALERFVAVGFTRLMAHPLILRDRVLGVINMSRRGTGAAPFSADDLAVLESLATQAAIAIENARLHDETEQRRREAEVIAELARTINASLDIDTVLQRLIEGARELCGSDLARIALREPGSDEMVFRYGVGTRYRRYDAFRLEPGKGVSGQVLVTGRPFRTDDYAGDPRITKDYLAVAREEGVIAELAVPIRIGDRVEGVLYVDNRVARPFTDRHEAVLLQLADHAALAIQNARLYATLEVRAARLRTLANVNRIVSSSLDIYEVLRTIACAASELMGAPLVAFWVADESTRTLKISGFSDDRLGADFPLAALAFGEGAAGWVAAHRGPLNIPDVFADERYQARDWSRAHGITSFFAVPIVLQDSLLGVLTLNGRAPFSFGPDDQSLLESFVAQAAVTLDHARLYAETSRRLEETRALLEVAEILNSTLDSKQLLKRVTIKIARVCRVDRCSIELWDGDRIVPLMAQFADGHRDPQMWAAFTALPPCAPGDVPAHARAIETHRPVLIDDTTATDLIPRQWIDAYGLKSYMAVPLIRQDEVIGVLNLDYCERVSPFQPWQVNLATAIAGQLALALENARLYAEAQERLRETTTLLAIGQVLSQPGPVDETLRRVAREVGQAFGADMVGAYVLDERGEALQPLAGYRVPGSLRAVFISHPIVLERIPRLLHEYRVGRVIWSPNTHDDERFDQRWVRLLPPHSVLLAPTRVRGESRGCLILVWWRTGRRFESAEIRLLEGVAAQIGLALENAELARQREVRLKETETLLAVSRTLSSTLDLDPLLRHFMRQITRAIGADTVGIWMLDGSGEWLAPTAGYHVPPEWLPAVREVRLSILEHPFYAEAARTKRAVFARNADADPRIPPFLTRIAPHRSQLFVPILAKERLIAGFVAVWREEQRDFSPGELALMEAIANQAGVAVENARLFEQNRRQVEELSVLHELARAVTGQLDQDALIDALHSQVGRILDARSMLIALRTEGGDEVDVPLDLRHGRRDPALPERYRLGSGLVSAILTTGRAIRTEDYLGECARRGVAAVPGVEAFPCWLGVPMRAGERVLGVLALRSAERAFTAADENLLANIADLAALALRSARLFEERTRAYGELAAAQDHLVRTEKLRALGEMASGVAHDFNNLLAAILGRTQLLLRRVEDPKLRQWLEVIERSATDGAQTVRRLQEFARIRRDEPLVPVDLNEVVRDALEITQSRWREESLRRGVAIEVRTELASLPRVAGDPAELREAMTNLILNAVDAMPDGGVLTLSSAVVDGQVEVAVSDTGVGIPEDLREKIFDPFFTTKGPQGTGLGLSMTYGILSRHGASIVVHSEKGRGSTFRLRFPPTDTAEARRPVLAPSFPAAGVLRCLVVDDEETVGEVIGDVLETVGHKAVVLTDGATAIARFRAEPFDVVFTDLAMPGVSGWQVARAVKEAAPEVPVFVVTGFGVELSPEERRAHGVEAIFSKPLKIEDIVEALAQVARKRASTNGPEER
jgi:GAF domain-containing protein/ActR/RegA family two-component response regulator